MEGSGFAPGLGALRHPPLAQEIEGRRYLEDQVGGSEETPELDHEGQGAGVQRAGRAWAEQGILEKARSIPTETVRRARC